MRDGVTKFLLAIIAVALAVIAVSLGAMTMQSSNKKMAADPNFRRDVEAVMNMNMGDIKKAIEDDCYIVDLDLSNRTGYLSCD